ncbi:hypothetical protein, partial [Streptococcus pneumoniae]|uniref:hypothetical protein n=1 Tax=Streptococcus pneumoniae TaxID=1313 RepID=UPI001CB797CC
MKYYQDWPEDAPILDRDYPHLWSYLKAHEKVLRAREKGRYRKGTPEEWCWYDLGRPQNLRRKCSVLFSLGGTWIAGTWTGRGIGWCSPTGI